VGVHHGGRDGCSLLVSRERRRPRARRHRLLEHPALGQVLYTDYVFAFEIAAVILLVAIVSAIALTLRSRKETKYQEPSIQLAANKADRLRS
jgi:hypothetical protein